MKKQPFLMVLFLVTILCAQDGTILPGQKSAIRSLATNAGFVGRDLTTYLIQNYGRNINGLTRIDGAEIIKAFQAGAIVKPAPFVQTKQKSPTLEIATILDVGMKKRFHFRDGTIRDGEILSIKDDIVSLQTGSGVFNIPSEEFLSETAEITNKKGELFKGSVLGETQEEFVVRTSYGDAVVPKRDIHTMNRYHGGILDVKTEEKTKFYQGDEHISLSLIHSNISSGVICVFI